MQHTRPSLCVCVHVRTCVRASKRRARKHTRETEEEQGERRRETSALRNSGSSRFFLMRSACATACATHAALSVRVKEREKRGNTTQKHIIRLRSNQFTRKKATTMLECDTSFVKVDRERSPSAAFQDLLNAGSNLIATRSIGTYARYAHQLG